MAEELPPPPPPLTANPETNGLPEPLKIEDELKDSYLSYAMSVIISRALPDVRDGLKPSQRRILLAMNDLGLAPERPRTKCAGIVGETMKRYHPHGDAGHLPHARAHGPGLEHAASAHPGRRATSAPSPANLPRPCVIPRPRCRPSPRRCSRISNAKRWTSSTTTTASTREPLRAAEQISQSARQRLRRHRGRHGHGDSAAQSRRGLQRHHPDSRRARRHHRAVHRDSARPRLPHGRHHLRPAGHLRRLPHRPRQGHASCPRPIDEEEAPDHHLRSAVSADRNRLHEAIGELVKDERIKGISDVRDYSSARERRTGQPHRLRSSAMPMRNWCSISSTSSRRCKRPSASSCWPWWTASPGCSTSSRFWRSSSGIASGHPPAHRFPPA